MDNKTSQDFNFESTDLITYVHLRRKPLLILTGIALVISTIVSFLIDERFESEVILFPASSSSISQSLLTENNTKKELLKFGEEEDVEQLLQVLYSDKIKNRIIQKYDLMEHYEIDADANYRRTKLNLQFDDNITYSKTEYMSVKIEVLDTDPQMAADIANDIAELVDSTMNKIQKERALKALLIVENEYVIQKRFIQKLEDSIQLIRSKGVMDYESQAEVLNEAYAKALSEGRTSGVKALEEKLSILAQYGGAYVSIRDLLVHEIKKLSIIESKYNEAKVDYEQDLPYKFIVSHAEKSERKAYPIRWLIITISSLSTFLLALILLILFDNIKKKKL
ncbi:MAG TPA: hypothetical protein DDX39_03655 [Bacteroidales bacterium]|nr:MAG: hypothetical protein A2W98_12665 [Bacteroidetes bacterium GWF2_33_38]OFY72468.1 MAG: hypothetical protein A2265_10310 [Bacteroidetes bacterium RIFOXYA12_FULL_33_9]OFY86243.1 MAG: hypothetical protein A2236_12480 [Bacteroidetes bacterium RIFOXYA2_FULL_33_7]HBF87716.1 hypothetical protein [Bacteroidales bacterium]